MFAGHEPLLATSMTSPQWSGLSVLVRNVPSRSRQLDSTPKLHDGIPMKRWNFSLSFKLSPRPTCLYWNRLSVPSVEARSDAFACSR